MKRAALGGGLGMAWPPLPDRLPKRRLPRVGEVAVHRSPRRVAERAQLHDTDAEWLDRAVCAPHDRVVGLDREYLDDLPAEGQPIPLARMRHSFRTTASRSSCSTARAPDLRRAPSSPAGCIARPSPRRPSAAPSVAWRGAVGAAARRSAAPREKSGRRVRTRVGSALSSRSPASADVVATSARARRRRARRPL